MELFTFNIAANETKLFAKAGAYFEIIDAAYPIDVFFYDRSGGRVDEARAALSGIYIEEQYAEFTVTNGALPQSVTLMLHTGRGGSRRQPGIVNVVDSARLQSFANQAFSGVFDIPAGAGAAAGVLWNPAGSGRIIEVDRVAFASPANDLYGLAICAAQASTLSAASSLYSGGAVPQGKAYYQNTGIGSLSLQSLIAQGYMQATVDRNIDLKRPIVIEEGRGVAFYNSAAQAMRGTMFFVERLKGTS